MFRKNYFIFLLAVALFLTGSTAAFAQAGMATGVVEVKKADGTTVPLADVVIDVYRTDVAGKLPSGKTNKKGEFTILGFLPGARYALAVSAPNVTADVFLDIKAGDERLTLTVVEGAGKRMTEEEVRKIIANPSANVKSGELTAEQKKQQEEFEKQVADVKARNTKVAETEAVIKKVLEEGSKAFQEKNYDLAIVKFDEGIAADPNYAGTTPVLLNNKTTALINRATINYNQGVKATDEATKTAAMTSVKKDLEDAAAAAERSLTILKSATAPDANVQKNYDANKFQALSNRKEVYRLMARTGANRTKGKETLTAYQEYLAAETDAKKKTDSQLALAETLQDTSEFDLAITEFEKILAESPNSVEALAGAGFSLVNVGYINNDKAKLQQGANYLQKFTDLAPDTHKYKNDAKGLIETLKKEQNVTPTKSTKKKQ